MARNKNLFTVQVQGPLTSDKDKVEAMLRSQLCKIPSTIQSLKIEEDTPSDLEWSIIGEHFSNIRELEMDTGYNEGFNDRNLPLHWPIERLLISSACAERVQTRFILEGKVKHLTLLLTSGLRFEGPSSEELLRAHHQAIDRGEKEPRFMTLHRGTPEERKIQVSFLPELVLDWMHDYNSRFRTTNERTDSSRGEVLISEKMDLGRQKLLPKEVSVSLDKLETLENGAIDTFHRMTLAIPHVTLNASILNLRSTIRHDLSYTNEELFPQFLCQLAELRTLVLSVGDIFQRSSLLPELYRHFPPNLTTLRFRGPISLVQSNQWDNWLQTFGSSDYLPNLKTLSFVLDLHYEDKRRRPVDAPDKMLHDARLACEEIYTVMRRKGVSVEPFYDQWSERVESFKQLDTRWI
ncbi:hypothetical protein UA08_09329 [Talaromyces atroroseus]|uniref:Uncharacterized protein n=1 Tax=Talaromyces atroroseus TaxID=1441469 RepID=A0A1Q5Q6M6_TALAT|nr:hypothetical protein UA08_09329 [Talaromyces atroroseus]OKL55423.1 hypothetical protein UA08_09329 [Talaromyces atroroseus]